MGHSGQQGLSRCPCQASDLASPSLQAPAPLGLWTGALAVLWRLRSYWGCNRKVCVRVHLAQPFSLQVRS